jgi:hypothetical protein
VIIASDARATRFASPMLQTLGENSMPSFDVVCEANMVEVKNAVEQSNKEISTRFDFKGSDSRVEQKEK